MEQGEHRFPFSFCLPPRIPSSFEGKCGHVRYEVVAKTDEGYCLSPVARDTFKVITPFDLTDEPAMSVSVLSVGYECELD